VNPSLRDIEWSVCAKFNLTRDEIRGPCKDRRIARPRQIAMYLARTHTRHSFPRIGRYFNKDHTTAVHAVKRIAALMIEKPKVAGYVAEILAVLPVRMEATVALSARLMAGEVILGPQ